MYHMHAYEDPLLDYHLTRDGCATGITRDEGTVYGHNK
jgi:hypothetical protein